MELEKYQTLAQRLGLNINIFKPEPFQQYHIWNGSDNNINITESMGGMEILHEISHYQIAHKDRRNTPEYGLGTGPEHWAKEIKALIHYSVANIEESFASWLTICYAKMIDDQHDYRRAIELLPDIRVVWEFRKSYDHYKWLLDKGFLLENGFPTTKLREKENLPNY